MKAISVLKHITTFCGVGLHNDCVEAIAELEEAMKPKTCEGCKWEQETNLIRTKVGDKVDICTLCTRYENLQDNFEPKDNA